MKVLAIYTNRNYYPNTDILLLCNIFFMSQEISEELKEEARVKARQYAEMMNVEYVDPYPPAAPADETQPTPQPEMSAEDLLKEINKRTGANLTSLDALEAFKPQPTAEELRIEAEKRNTEMLTYGLANGKFKKEDYDAYQLALANKKELVKSEIREKLTLAFPEMAPEAIEEKVANYMFEHLDETDPLRVARENEIMTLSDMKIKDKFKNIVDLPKDFDQYHESINSKANFERKKQAALPVYKSDVSAALKSLQNFTVPVPDSKNPQNTVNVPLGYSDTDLKEVEDMFLADEQFSTFVRDGYTPEQLKETADFILWKKHGPRLISQAAKGYNSTQKETYLQARKGLNPGMDAIEVTEENMGSDLDKMYDEMMATAEQ